MDEEKQISLTFDRKDGRWRWLAEVGIKCRAGEEYALTSALSAAERAINDLSTEVQGG